MASTIDTTLLLVARPASAPDEVYGKIDQYTTVLRDYPVASSIADAEDVEDMSAPFTADDLLYLGCDRLEAGVTFTDAAVVGHLNSELVTSLGRHFSTVNVLESLTSFENDETRAQCRVAGFVLR